MIRHIDWLHYNELYAVMAAHGFTSEARPDGGTAFRHPRGEILLFPHVDTAEPVITYHYGAVRKAMADYGIMTRDAFDLALLQAAHRLPTLTP